MPTAPFDLTTLARVRALMPLTPTTHDAMISAQLIPQWSARVAEALKREIKSESRVQTTLIPKFAERINLEAFPVSAVASVEYGIRTDELEALTEHEQWILETDRHLRVLFTVRADPAWLQVTYTGGIAADTTAFLAALPDVAGALDAQIVHALNRRGDPEGKTETFAGGSTVHKGLEFISELQQAIDIHAARVIV